MDQYEKDKVLLFKSLKVSSYVNVKGHRADELLNQILVTHHHRNIANCRDEDGSTYQSHAFAESLMPMLAQAVAFHSGMRLRW
jgi:hypothetical protein